MEINEFIDNNKENLINSIKETIKFKSISNKVNEENAPFGEECKNVLDYVLNLGNEMGFRTKNVDGYCGYIEFGEGEEMLGIIGHLDVVPAHIEDGWESNPFEAQIRDNKIYGRGSLDDKGPVMASLYAMKAVSQNMKLSKRVRLILGLNEEKNWECINYYKRNEEHPTISFSPDGNFPCIYAEKGIITIRLEKSFGLNIGEILEMSSSDNAINVVPKLAYMRIKLNNPQDISKFYHKENIYIEDIGNSVIKIVATGKAAHAAHPNLGDNAIRRLLEYINEIEPNDYIKFLLDEGFFECESPKCFGGVCVIDESGILTSNIGVLKFEDGILKIYTNLRVPVNTNFDFIQNKCDELKAKCDGLNYGMEHLNNPLLVDKESYLVKTLTKIFNEETYSNEEPLAIGGGTYARAFKNCVCYGMMMPGDEDLCHQVNENIDIDKLMTTTKIYAKAIVELAK